MVHNGIEYGDMQLIAEAYHLMRSGLGLSVDEIQRTFAEWNLGVLDSYLVEITANILEVKEDDGTPLLDRILDTAGQKGTGKWTGINALELGVPLTLIGEAVFARFLSARKEERVAASAMFDRGKAASRERDASAVAALHDALYASKIVSYAQGYMLMREAAQEHGWNLNYGGIALMWRGGCIIRSRFLGKIRDAFAKDPELSNLLVDDFFKQAVARCQGSWRRVVARAARLGIPLPAMSSALAFYDGYRHGRLPANMLQAQRDYFGAHTYERVDKPRGEFFHTNWTGRGGETVSRAYNA
jgi:6-phosphogluconate dehydrogenase